MKRTYLKPIFIFLIVSLVTFFICLKINNNFSVLSSGEAYVNSDENKNKIASLTNYHWDMDTNYYYFDIVREDENQKLELVYGNLPCDVLINEKTIKETSSFSRISVDSKWFKDNTVKLVFHTNKSPYHVPIYLTTTDVADSILLTFNMIYAFSLGITLTMSIYGFFLYYNKPTEKYLLWFALYTGVLTLWSAFPLFSGSNMQWIRYYAYAWCVFLDIIICFKIFNIKLSKPFDWLLSKKGIVAILILWTLLETVLPIIHNDVSYYIMFLISIGALVYACANKIKGAWMLLFGHAISQGFRMIMALSYFSWINVSFPFRAMQYSKLFNLPLVFCCMVLINKLFAEKFTEAELLSIELKQLNKNLDQKVLKRTQALEEQQRQRRSFMLNIFHDLRTPLFIIKGCTEKITNEPQLLNKELPIIKERVDFTQQLVEDLFLMAKLEDKQVIFETERVQLNVILQNIVYACRIEAEKKDISINTDLSVDCTTWGDEHRIKQALQNLILNAIYYTPPKGKIFITINRDKDLAAIEFTDTGIGIESNEIDKIFDRYYRISKQGKHESTGLGLSIANEIIQHHHGKINVVSQRGKGTTFTVFLPVVS